MLLTPECLLIDGTVKHAKLNAGAIIKMSYTVMQSLFEIAHGHRTIAAQQAHKTQDIMW